MLARSSTSVPAIATSSPAPCNFISGISSTLLPKSPLNLFFASTLPRYTLQSLSPKLYSPLSRIQPPGTGCLTTTLLPHLTTRVAAPCSSSGARRDLLYSAAASGSTLQEISWALISMMLLGFLESLFVFLTPAHFFVVEAFDFLSLVATCPNSITLGTIRFLLMLPSTVMVLSMML